MNVIFILISVRSEFQLKDWGSIVMIKFFIIEYRVRSFDICLGKRDLLRLFQSDVGRRLTVFGISGVVIVIIDGHDTGGKV